MGSLRMEIALLWTLWGYALQGRQWSPADLLRSPHYSLQAFGTSSSSAFVPYGDAAGQNALRMQQKKFLRILVDIP